MSLHLNDLRASVRAELKLAGLRDPSTEADLLLASALGISRGEVQLGALLDREILPSQAEAVARMRAGRARRIPLQHLSGRAPFLDMELAVGDGAFVPRPETESLVTEAARLVAAMPLPDVVDVRAADIGSGSGAVALGLATTIPRARVTAVERSRFAWPWLRANVSEFGGGRVAPFFGDARRYFQQVEARSLHLVASNPPYVPAAALPEQREVWRHDPGEALYSGLDGLDFIRDLVGWAAASLTAGGAVILEHEEQQGERIRQLLEARGLVDARTVADLTGRDRLTAARAPGS